jgi:transposase
MNRRAKVELFEEIRREYEFGIGTIKGVAKKLGVHRRMVRQALKDAMPPERKKPERESPKLDQVREFIDTIVGQDRKMPRKQRHTATRIYNRIRQELEIELGKSTVSRYVRAGKAKLGLLKAEVFVPQIYSWGVEAQVDWYEAYVEMGGEREKVQVFSMRSMGSGGAFHRVYPRATQQAFFEGHQLAFNYFGGVFALCRFDNLTSAVKKILRGHTREEATRFIAFRSHWKFEAAFCNPGKGNEKGGVEGEVGYFRRNHFVPLPVVKDYADLNEQLLAACCQDQQRLIGERQQRVGETMLIEQPYLLPLAVEEFELAEVSFPIVDSKSCVKVRGNWYSVPVRVGLKVRVKILPAYIEAWHEGRLVARHNRCYEQGRQILDLEHYLDVLEYKVGAFAGSKPLAQWRAAGRWPAEFDSLWQSLQRRLGKQAGTQAMIELLRLGREHGYEKLKGAINQALASGCTDAAAIKHLIDADNLAHQPVLGCDIGLLTEYERPLPQLDNYDQLLEVMG